MFQDIFDILPYYKSMTSENRAIFVESLYYFFYEPTLKNSILQWFINNSPEGFIYPASFDITELNLSSNLITSLIDMIKDDMGLRTIPNILRNLTNLEIINFSNNNLNGQSVRRLLESLPQSVVKIDLSSKYHLLLEDNNINEEDIFILQNLVPDLQVLILSSKEFTLFTRQQIY